MSDAVALALIGMFRSWGEMFVQHAAVIVPAVGSAVVGYMTWRNNSKSETRAKEIRAEVERLKALAAISEEHADLIAKGAERRGVEIGIKTERLRTSDMQALRAGFKPQDTDAYMASTEPDKPPQR